jgi:voltage-gated sodium channel
VTRTLPDRWAGPCQRIADSTVFTVGIFGVIVANAVALGLETFAGVEQSVGHVLQQLDHVFIGIFVVELVIRIGAYGSRPQDFFKDGWNIFDFIVITAAFVPGLRENATLLRLLRLARVLRLVRILPELRLLVTSIWRSLPGVASLGVLGVLMLYVYGMVGWVLFHERYPQDWGSVGQAMLTLFIMLSLENLPSQIQQGQAVSNWTLIYYVSYVLVAAFLLVNILIGVVINSMEEAREIEWQREQRRNRGGPTTEDDRQAAIEQRLHELRAAVNDLEHELHRPPPD